MPNDDQMTRLLAEALGPEDRQPSDARVAALRAHVLASPPSRRPVVLRRVAVGFAVTVALAGGLVLGHELPGPLRDAARAIGLPVESSTLVDARAELDRLGNALAQRDQDEIIAADNAMLGLVKRLDDEEKAKIVPVAHEVHERAVAFLRQTGRCPREGTCPPNSA